MAQVKSMKESPKDWSVDAGRECIFGFYLWVHELKGPYELRASGGNSVAEWRTKQTEVSRREWAENGKE